MLTEDQQIFDQIKKAKNILISCQEDYSGDDLASALVFLLFLHKLEKKATVVINNFKTPQNFNFLPNINDITRSLSAVEKFIISLSTNNAQAENIIYQTNGNKIEFIITPKEGEFTDADVTSSNAGPGYDLIIVVGSSDLDSLGDVYNENTAFFFTTPIINIDHHPNNEKFGQINKIDITAISTTEIIYQLFKEYSTDVITPEIATCLLTGIISESKSFKIGSLTPNSLLIASKLITLGADREIIIRNLYQSHKINTLKLWGRVLAKLKNSMNGKLVWSSLNKNDFTKTETNPNNLTGVIEELIVNVPQAEIIVLLAEDNAHVTVDIYTNKNVDASSLVKAFAGHGSKNHATFSTEKPIVETEQKIIEHIKQKLAKLPL